LLAQRGRLPRPIYIGQHSPRWRRSDLLQHIDELANQA
jgi:predicted DNA-binding transcriptional regulator AlpA